MSNLIDLILLKVVQYSDFFYLLLGFLCGILIGRYNTHVFLRPEFIMTFGSLCIVDFLVVSYRTYQNLFKLEE